MEHLDHEIIEQYHRGEISDQFREKLEAHLLSCQECNERFKHWEIFRTAIAERERPESSPDFVSDIMKRISRPEQEVSSSPLLTFIRNWGIQSLATTCSLIVIFSISFDTQSLDTDAFVLTSFESEIISYGYSDNSFNLSKVVGFSNLEEVE